MKSQLAAVFMACMACMVATAAEQKPASAFDRGHSGWGTRRARNEIVAIPLLAQRYMGRAK